MESGPGVDGARGYTAQQGLEAVLGGKDIDKMNKREGAMLPDEMRAYLMARNAKGKVSYEEAARRFAKVVLKEADKNKDAFLKDSHGFANKICDKGNYDLTGFMFGWAVNTVRYVLGNPSGGNPAIISL